MKAVEPILAQSIRCRDDSLVLILKPGPNELAIPWERCSGRLSSASTADRARCELSPGGYGVHWPALDEDISVAGLLARMEGAAR